LISRAEQRCGPRAAELHQAYRYLLEIAQRLEPSVDPQTGVAVAGCAVRQRVEAALAEAAAAVADGRLPDWLQPPLAHLVLVLRRLGDGLYHCYDVPGLPRTNNDLEHFYRQLKAQERRITGHRRSDAFVVRVGGFAVYAAAATGLPEADLRRQLATVSAADWQRERALLHANQERQTKMRRFRLHRSAYLADLEARWAQLTEPP
jgi:hypothetical protein